jgi:hypothetical protein
MSKALSKRVRVVALSGLSAAVAPLVFVSIIAARKLNLRLGFVTRHWTTRLRRELARWT